MKQNFTVRQGALDGVEALPSTAVFAKRLQSLR
jgi:hypothetical protein